MDILVFHVKINGKGRMYQYSRDEFVNGVKEADFRALSMEDEAHLLAAFQSCSLALVAVTADRVDEDGCVYKSYYLKSPFMQKPDLNKMIK